MSLGLVGIFLIIFSIVKLGVHDPVGLIGVVVGFIVLFEVFVGHILPHVKT